MKFDLLAMMFVALLFFVSCGESTSNFVDGDVDDIEKEVNLENVVINEIVAKSATTEDWIELYNNSSTDIDISNYQLLDNKDTESYIIPAGTIVAANDYLVFERDKTGESSFAFGLSVEDAVRLLDSDNELIDSCNWKDGEAPEGKSWGRSPNGIGNFKTLVSPTRGKVNLDNCGDDNIDTGEECDNDNLNNKSCEALGFLSGNLLCTSDCSFDYKQCVSASSEVTINEVVAKTTDVAKQNLPDWIEIYNPGNKTNISGWIIKDNDDRNIYRIEEDTFIEAGEYLVFEYDQTGLTGFKFGIGVADSVRLYNRASELLSETNWKDGQAPDTKSWGRIPDGSGNFKTLDNVTKGSANTE